MITDPQRARDHRPWIPLSLHDPRRAAPGEDCAIRTDRIAGVRPLRQALRAKAKQLTLLLVALQEPDLQSQAITAGTAQHMLIRRLIEREGSADRFGLTGQGRAVLEALMMKAAARAQ